MLQGLVALFVVCVVALAVSLFFNLRDVSEWNPLGAYPQQTVVNPIVRPSDQVTIRAVKCVSAHYPVNVKGVLQWQSVQPAGTVIVVGDGAAVRYPADYAKLPTSVPRPGRDGCTTFTYTNPIPLAVVSRSAEVCRQSTNAIAPSWRITGVETPVDDSRSGVARAWQSDVITVRCDA